MAVNTYRAPEEDSSEKGQGFFGMIRSILRFDESLERVIHVKFLPQLLFIVGLSVLYIANRHYAEKKTRAIGQLEVQVEDLRADYTTLKATYMFDSKQSEVAKRAARLGLVENEGSPILITNNTSD